MVKFINKYTGGVMLVDESRADHYEALGHTRADLLTIEVAPVSKTPAAVKTQPRRSAARRKDSKEW